MEIFQLDTYRALSRLENLLHLEGSQGPEQVAQSGPVSIKTQLHKPCVPLSASELTML